VRHRGPWVVSLAIVELIPYADNGEKPKPKPFVPGLTAAERSPLIRSTRYALRQKAGADRFEMNRLRFETCGL
jgi:hypothetical protein